MLLRHKILPILRLEADRLQGQIASHRASYRNGNHASRSIAQPARISAYPWRTFGDKAKRFIRTNTRPSTNPITTQPRYMPQSMAIRAMLASRPNPTMLFVAPRSNIYMISACSIGTFCLVYGIFNLYDISVNQHDGLWWVIPILMNFVSTFMLVVGCAAFFRARNVVKHLKAVPVMDRQGTRNLVIEIEARRLLPFLGPSKLVTCAPDDVVLKTDIRSTIEGLYSLEAAPGGWNQKPSGLKRLLYSVRALTSGDGFALLLVRGSTWRMDLGAGKIIDSGQVLDRLFRHKE